MNVQQCKTVLAATMLLVFLPGCGDAIRDFVRFLSICFWIVVAIVVCILLVVLVEAVAGHFADAKRERLERAPSAYNNAARGLQEFLPGCKSILEAELARGASLDPGSPFELANRKSISLTHQARDASRLLYESDPQHGLYQAKRESERLHQCCSRCRERNTNRREAVCLALRAGHDVQVDLNFTRQASE